VIKAVFSASLRLQCHKPQYVFQDSLLNNSCDSKHTKSSKCSFEEAPDRDRKGVISEYPSPPRRERTSDSSVKQV